MRRRAGAGCLVVIVLCTLAHQFEPQAAIVWTSGVAAALFLVVERARIPPSIRRVSMVIGAVSVALLPLTRSPAQSLEAGIAIGGLMVSLVASVSLLARAALESPFTGTVAEHLLASSARSRYAWFALAAQLFGGLLGMAGVNLLLQMAGRERDGDAAERLSVVAAIVRSFSAATLWSPMVSNMAILLALYPGLSWARVVPLTLALAAGGLVIGWALERWRTRRLAAGPAPARPDPPLAGALVPLVGGMAAFLAAVLAVSHGLGIAAVGAIVLVVPPVALALHAWQGTGPARWRNGLRTLRLDVRNLPLLAGEVALFMVAGCGGTVIAGAVPVAWTAAVCAALADSPILACATLMAIVQGLAFAAVHPVLSAVLVASTLPPAALHLGPLVHLAAILVGWSVSACSTPYSMLALMASRHSGYSIYAVTTRVNYGYALLSTGLGATVLGVASRWASGA